MSTPAELLTQSLAKLQTANRIDGTKNSYRKDNPNEYAKVIAYLQGGARPAGVTSDMGLGLVLEEDARRALLVEPPPDPPPTTPPIFDGSATRMTALWSTSTSNRGQTPQVWGGPGESGFGFIDNDITLIPDSRYTQVYRHRVKGNSGNGYYDPGPLASSSYMATPHAPEVGVTRWYTDAIKVQSPYTCTDWGLLWQLNYGQSSPPMALALNCGQNSTDGQLHFGVYRNGGSIASVGSQPPPAQQQFTQLNTGGAFLDKWVEFVVGIHWSQTVNDLTGWYEVYTRTKDNGESGFTLRDSRFNILTMQFLNSGLPAMLVDKQDQYFGYWSSGNVPASGFPTNYVQHKGLVKWADKASAFAAMGA